MIAGEPVTAPAREAAVLDGGPGVAHQRNKEMYIVQAQEAESENFFGDEQMPDVGLAEACAGDAGAGLVERGRVEAEFDVEPHHLAPNGYLHAGSIVTLADTACGYGARTVLPDGAVGFTTIELKSNFLGTALEGTLRCVASMVHGGRTTQVWDAIVTAGERTVALFRCTQLVLYPKA